MSTACARRLSKELADLKKADQKTLRDIQVADNNMLVWNALLVPPCGPYSAGAFRVLIEFSAEYPFKPPVVTLKTPIYHLNVDEKGLVCLPIIHADKWKPATRIEQVVEALVKLIMEPEPDHPLRGDLAEEYNRDKEAFFKKAAEFTAAHAEKRPD